MVNRLFSIVPVYFGYNPGIHDVRKNFLSFSICILFLFLFIFTLIFYLYFYFFKLLYFSVVSRSWRCEYFTLGISSSVILPPPPSPRQTLWPGIDQLCTIDTDAREPLSSLIKIRGCPNLFALAAFQLNTTPGLRLMLPPLPEKSASGLVTITIPFYHTTFVLRFNTQNLPTHPGPGGLEVIPPPVFIPKYYR